MASKTNLNRLKRAMLLRASRLDTDGCLDLHNHGYSSGDRFGRITPKVAARNRRLLSAVDELINEGFVEDSGSRQGLYATTGMHCTECIEQGRDEIRNDQCQCRRVTVGGLRALLADVPDDALVTLAVINNPTQKLGYNYFHAHVYETMSYDPVRNCVTVYAGEQDDET